MHVCLHLDRSRLFRWHSWLVKSLTELPGCDVSVTFATRQQPLPQSCGLLFKMERGLYGALRETAIDPIAPSIFEYTAASPPYDIVIDLADDRASLPTGNRILTPYYKDIPGEIGVITALLVGMPLSIEIRDSAHPDTPWVGQPALADRKILLWSVDNALSCTVGMLMKAMTDTGTLDVVAKPFQTRVADNVMRQAYQHAAGTFLTKIGKLIERKAVGPNHWIVAWRPTDKRILDSDSASFAVLPDDGARFYADPFPFAYHGRQYVFVEEFPYHINRGQISVFQIENGIASKPVPVLEEPHHLSYPNVFEHDGQIWMIPESGESEGVYLYRATKFPYRWAKEGCLVATKGYDATLLFPSESPDGRYWMFVCQQFYNSSSWDILSIYHADRLTGDWLPHARNPVLFDASFGRPAGAIFRHNGRLIRPVQDCSRIYGDGVHLCAINTLSRDEFSQNVIGTINCQPFGGCHTYNHNHGLEVIDLFGRNVPPLVTATMTNRAFVNRVAAETLLPEPVETLLTTGSNLPI